MIGEPRDRVDGPLKVSGRATYTYEEWAGPPLYGFMVEAAIARGRITRIDTTRAERAPGVQLVLTHRNAPRQGEPDEEEWGYERARPVLTSTEIRWFGEPVALVVAATFEQARAAAALLEVDYEAAPGRFDFGAKANPSDTPEGVNAGLDTDSQVGDFDAAFSRAPIRIDALYTTPYVHSQPLEPHCCLAVWSGDRVTVYASCQTLADAKARIASTFELEPHRVRVLSRFIGGGFGSKLGIEWEAILAVMAAHALGRPVKVAATRQQIFHRPGHRPASRQHVRLGASPDGRLVAFAHDTTQKTCARADYVEQIATTGRALYAAPSRRTTHRVVPLDLPPGGDVRAPGEAPGLLAIESAMDELAHALELDPIELRIRNEPARHPETGVPFSQRRLVECMREGARRFGWDRRPKTPASVRQGRWLIGYGMAAAIRPHYQAATTVKVRLDADGVALVQSDTTDIGTGTYTILAQVASEALGVPIDRVRVDLGDSDHPESAGSGGSWGAANTCTALFRACRALRERAYGTLLEQERHANGDLADVVALHFPEGLEATGSVPSQSEERSYEERSLSSYGAHFAEVHVDADTAEIRLRRMLGVFDAGRILNAKTARSQLIGGMIWGVSAALHEEAVVDPRKGAFVNRDLAQYLVPVHADVPAVDAIMLDGFDHEANELGAKGLGEVGICGSGAAIANAIFSATGVRVRDFPITLEKLLPHLPSAG